jgi:hypothetical protein
MIISNTSDKFEKLFELNKRLSAEIQSSLPAVIESLGKSKFKYTGKALLSFIPKSGYLNSAILELSASRNVYSAAVLYRSIIEHSFRQLYIYTKALKDDSDDVGKIYCKTLKASEDLQWFDKVNKHNKKVGENKTAWSTKGDHNESIRNAKREFLFSNILSYLQSNHTIENEEIKKFVNDHILERSVEYDNLSSAVHGGPFGESALFTLHQDKKKYDDTLYKFANESLGLHYSIVQSTYLFAYLMDEKMQEQYEKIRILTER